MALPTAKPVALAFKFYAGATIGAIVRQAPGHRTEVIIAHHDTVIEPEDHVIVFVANKRLIPRVEKLFQVSVGFF